MAGYGQNQSFNRLQRMPAFAAKLSFTARTGFAAPAWHRSAPWWPAVTFSTRRQSRHCQPLPLYLLRFLARWTLCTARGNRIPKHLPAYLLDALHAVSSVPRDSILRSAASMSRGPMVDMGILPMDGITSFSSQEVSLFCVADIQSAAVLASQSSASVSNVFAAASALACLSFFWLCWSRYLLPVVRVPCRAAGGLCLVRIQGKTPSASVLRLSAWVYSMRQYFPPAYTSRYMSPPSVCLLPAGLPVCFTCLTKVSASAIAALNGISAYGISCYPVIPRETTKNPLCLGDMRVMRWSETL